jgi:hypothetical protein
MMDIGKRESSFFEKKEAKELYSRDRDLETATGPGAKVFWFFFLKKNCFLVSSQAKSVENNGKQTVQQNGDDNSTHHRGGGGFAHRLRPIARGEASAAADQRDGGGEDHAFE